jgi:transcriptional regulator with XRE-family HTH domain
VQPEKARFIELFERSGWSQAEVARQLEMTRGGVNGIITGDANVSISVLRHFEMVLQSNGLKDAPQGTPALSIFEVRRELGRLIEVNRQMHHRQEDLQIKCGSNGVEGLESDKNIKGAAISGAAQLVTKAAIEKLGLKQKGGLPSASASSPAGRVPVVKGGRHNPAAPAPKQQAG